MRDGEEGGAGEEFGGDRFGRRRVGVDGFAGCDAEDLPGALCVVPCEDGGVDADESLLVEERPDPAAQCVAQAEHGRDLGRPGA